MIILCTTLDANNENISNSRHEADCIATRSHSNDGQSSVFKKEEVAALLLLNILTT